MDRLTLVLFDLCCILPALANAVYVGNPFRVKGRVYCDTCRCGFETSATKYLAGARVRIECKDSNGIDLKYSTEGVTDATGTYDILVAYDHGDQLCDAVLVSSPDSECATPNRGRDRARAIVTRSNGMISDVRSANNMGFLKDQPMPGCTQLLKSYFESDD